MTIEAWNALKRGFCEDERVVANKAFLTRDAKVYYPSGMAIFDAARFENGESFWSNSDGFVARIKRAYQAFLKEFRRAR